MDRLNRNDGNIYFDSHLHSVNSHDGRSSVEAVCEAAIARGLSGIAFTDHLDLDDGASACMAVLGGLASDVEASRAVFGDRLKISIGIEFGEMNHDPAAADEIAGDPRLDFVLASLHSLRGERDFYYRNYDTGDTDALIERYYRELYEIADRADFDVMAHINYQVRYMSRRAREAVNFAAHEASLRPVLRRIAERGKGIEINTSATSRYEDDIVPSLAVLRIFREEGGEIVTVGSDSHNASTLGHRSPDALAILREAGFTRHAFFTRRKPELFDIK